MTDPTAQPDFTVDRILKQRKLERLIQEGKFTAASKLARELGVELPQGQIVDMHTARDRGEH